MTRRRKLGRSPGQERRLARRAAARGATEERARTREDREGWVVCETCGLEQPYRTAEPPVKVAPCARRGCGGLYCWTIESREEREEG